MMEVKNKGSYQPEIIKPVIRITDDLPAYFLVYSKSPQQEYTILCKLNIKGRSGHKEPRSMEVIVYYNHKLLQMDQAAEELIQEYLTPVTYKPPSDDQDQEEDTVMQPVINLFGEAAAWELFHARCKIQEQTRKWAYAQIGQEELREPVAYIRADYEETNYHLPDDFHYIFDGMEQALYDSGLKPGEWMYAIFLAGYLKGNRETDLPLPSLVKESLQHQILSKYNICL